MTRIRATCPACGEVELQPQDVVLTLRHSDTGLVGDGSSYRFDCPDCFDLVTKPADERIAQLLSNGGVPIEDTDDGELLDALLRPAHPERWEGGAPFSADDVLALHELLQDDGWFDRLVSALD
jgi:predicted RNA-binding Zn-ribbon protein involved in translation (DUF1610 family)